MEKEHKSVKEMWERYVISIGDDNTDRNYTYWYFYDNEKDADDLAELVKQGVKKATSSLYYLYQVEEESLPKVGDISIITDWHGIAKCIIETKNVTILPFKEITQEFAKAEGEGDKSLEYWRRVHVNFFTGELKEYKMEFNEDMLVVCEEFETVLVD